MWIAVIEAIIIIILIILVIALCMDSYEIGQDVKSRLEYNNLENQCKYVANMYLELYEENKRLKMSDEEYYQNIHRQARETIK